MMRVMTALEKSDEREKDEMEEKKETVFESGVVDELDCSCDPASLDEREDDDEKDACLNGEEWTFPKTELDPFVSKYSELEEKCEGTAAVEGKERKSMRGLEQEESSGTSTGGWLSGFAHPDL